MNLSIAYMTNRRDPKIQWFFDSLHQDLGACYNDITRLIIVDFYADEPGRKEAFAALFRGPKALLYHVTPKPTVWQGKYLLTKEDFFAASNARNTAICLAPDGYIAFVDDLSVLVPGWMDRVRAAMAEGYIVYGTYQKVLGLIVDNGLIKGFREHSAGFDSRLKMLPKGQRTHSCAGSWLYGCSLAASVEAFLKINGFDEDCDSLGSEDSICGIMLGHAGYRFVFDMDMMTYESEEDHFVEPPFKRMDKGQSPNDKSHKMLNMALKGRWIAPNHFEPGGIRLMRERVLAGQPFPISQIPQHDWYDKQPIQEM